jgi:hypothetical protein
MADIIELAAVDWFIPPAHDLDMPAYRACDICFERVVEDIWAGKPESEWRKFWLQRGGVNDGLTVCEACMDEFLSEPLE